jgi:polysaccharide biosynthesis transport protein
VELADYFLVLRRRWWLIVLIAAVCSGGAAATTFAKAPQYTATTRLLVSGGQSGGANDEISRRQLANQRAVAYAQLVDTGPADAAAAQAADSIASNASTSAIADGNSPFIVITVQAGSAQAAQQIANSYVVVLPDVIRRLEQTPSSSPPEISTLEAATLPAAPTSPVHQRDILIGVVLGLVLGMSAALIREALDARVRDSSEIERRTGAALLGSVPKERSSDRLVSMTKPRSARAEAYRHVRTQLEFAGTSGLPRSIVVTSASPSEGKSSLSANLAIAAARSGRDVVLVDADLRKPSIAKYFGVKPALGLSDVLQGTVDWNGALIPVEGERIHLLPAGQIPSFPGELVGSAQMVQLIQELEDQFDLVVIDSPPVLPVSDALIMGVNAGGVVLVARMRITRRAALIRAIEAVRKVDANLLGVVANAAMRREEKAYGDGYGYTYGNIRRSRGADQAPPVMQPALRRSSGRHSAPSADDTVPAPGAPLAPAPAAPPAAVRVLKSPGGPARPAPARPAPARLDLDIGLADQDFETRPQQRVEQDPFALRHPAPVSPVDGVPMTPAGRSRRVR